MTKDPQVQLKDDLLITSLDEQEGIVLDVDSKSYHLLNETGLFVMNYLQQSGGHMSYSALRNRLVEEYEVSEDAAEADLVVFLKRLGDESLATFLGNG